MGGKDRQKHEEARGKKLSLADLSKELPTEDELLDYPELLRKESDRGAAVMGGAFVENTLSVAIRARIADPGEAVVKTWFEGPNAPFGHFAAKIKLGRALAIYGPDMDQRLTLVKDIRNAFAHSSRPLDFSHPAMVAACKKLSPEPNDDTPPRVMFGWACRALGRLLVADAFENGGKELEVRYE